MNTHAHHNSSCIYMYMYSFGYACDTLHKYIHTVDRHSRQTLSRLSAEDGGYVSERLSDDCHHLTHLRPHTAVHCRECDRG